MKRPIAAAKSLEGCRDGILPSIGVVKLSTDIGNIDGVATVASVSRALQILKCFSLETPELGVTEISRRLNFNKSTTYRLLTTLEREEFLYQVEGGRYALSFTVLEIAAGIEAADGVREVILESLRRLVDRTGETAHLAVLDAGEVLYVEKVEGTWSLRMPSAVGRRVPLNCTGLGKVLLAGLPPEEAERVVRSRIWESRTRFTITDSDQLMSEINLVRDQGFALDREEIEEGLLCIATPIRDDHGVTCAGISIAAPASRIAPKLEEEIQAVVESGAWLSQRLGPLARRLREAARVS